MATFSAKAWHMPVPHILFHGNKCYDPEAGELVKKHKLNNLFDGLIHFAPHPSLKEALAKQAEPRDLAEAFSMMGGAPGPRDHLRINPEDIGKVIGIRFKKSAKFTPEDVANVIGFCRDADKLGNPLVTDEEPSSPPQAEFDPKTRRISFSQPVESLAAECLISKHALGRMMSARIKDGGAITGIELSAPRRGFFTADEVQTIMRCMEEVSLEMIESVSPLRR
jgi:hypothetical protein